MKYTVLIVILHVLIQCSYGQDRKVITDTLLADSIVQVFHKNGELFYQVPYKKGKQNGWYEQYHENGAIWTKDFRINGKTVDGYYVALYDNGNVYQEGFYKNGHQVGKWYCFTKDGEPFKIYTYNKNGDWVKLKVWNPEKRKWEKSGLY